MDVWDLFYKHNEPTLTVEVGTPPQAPTPAHTHTYAPILTVTLFPCAHACTMHSNTQHNLLFEWEVQSWCLHKQAHASQCQAWGGPRAGHQDMQGTRTCRAPRHAGHQDMQGTKTCRAPRHAGHQDMQGTRTRLLLCSLQHVQHRGQAERRPFSVWANASVHCVQCECI